MDVYLNSTQYRNWKFTTNELVNIRTKANTDATKAKGIILF